MVALTLDGINDRSDLPEAVTARKLSDSNVGSKSPRDSALKNSVSLLSGNSSGHRNNYHFLCAFSSVSISFILEVVNG